MWTLIRLKEFRENHQLVPEVIINKGDFRIIDLVFVFLLEIESKGEIVAGQNRKGTTPVDRFFVLVL